MKIPLSTLVTRIILGVVVGCAVCSGYFWLRSRVATTIYRERLTDLTRDYGQLRGRYNQAIRKTAVTELVVVEGEVSVRIRTAEGALKTVATPYDPAGEIYVDYVVSDGRLWIRRVFDAKTPPKDGVVIDSQWLEVDWDSEQAQCGKAVYRALTPGVWTVTVTGDGSLGLVKQQHNERVDLTPAPRVRDYSEAVELADDATRRISPAEIVRSLTP